MVGGLGDAAGNAPHGCKQCDNVRHSRSTCDEIGQILTFDLRITQKNLISCSLLLWVLTSHAHIDMQRSCSRRLNR